MSAVLTFPTRRSLGHVEADLAAHERAVDVADRLEREREQYGARVHAELRARVLSAFALLDSNAPIPNYTLSTGPGTVVKLETSVLPVDVFEEAWSDPAFKTLVLDMLADNNLASQKARLRAASFYADQNADDVAEARNWGLPS